MARSRVLRDRRGLKPELPDRTGNPLRGGTVLAFAVLFVAVLVATARLRGAFGTVRLYAVAAIVDLGGAPTWRPAGALYGRSATAWAAALAI